MKPFIFKLFAFSIFSLLFYMVGIVVYSKCFPQPSNISKNLKTTTKGYGYTALRLKEADEASAKDILVLGSSHAYRGYDPRIFKKYGYSIQNLGTSSQALVQTEILLKAYLENIKPRLVILDIYPVLLNSTGLESSLDILANHKLDSDYVDILFKNRSIEVLNASILMKYKELFEDYEYNQINYPDDIYVQGGFVEAVDQKFKETDSNTGSKSSFDEEQLEAFNRILELVDQNKLKLVLVQAPVEKEKYESYYNKEVEDFLSDQGVTYLNFNEILDLPNSYFLDSSHLNQKGVEVFNDVLLDSLKITLKELKNKTY